MSLPVPSDAQLAEAGVRRIEVPIPIPVEPVNAYLVGERDLVMIDCGPIWSGSVDRLLAAVRPSERVRHIVVTHGHADHHGAAAELARALGATVCCHPSDLRAVRDFRASLAERYEKWNAVARANGLPGEVSQRMREHYKMLSSFGAEVPAVEPVEGGSVIEAGGRELEVLHVPGHTAGSIALLDRANRMLFSGDTVLPGISPNPFFEGLTDEPSGPRAFLKSLERLRDLPVDLVLPGHGAPLGDLESVLDEYEAHHAERRGAILRVLSRSGPATAYAIVKELFPTEGRVGTWLAIAEVVGHLQYLEAESLVAPEPSDGVAIRWKLSS